LLFYFLTCYSHILIVKEVSLWNFHICLQCILVRFSCTIILLHLSAPYLNHFNRFHFSFFI
jgi:hypothetical protein